MAKKVIPKCSECEYKLFVERNGSPSRYYCDNPDALVDGKGPGQLKICNCDRYSDELKMKTSPRWCPKRNQELTKK